MSRLSATQTNALQQLYDAKAAGRKWSSASDLKVNLNTLYALSSRGYADYKHGAGSFAYPRTGISWQITEAGIEILKAA